VIPPSHNAEFVAAMERVLDVYRRPFDAVRPVVCTDETPRQLITEARTPLPARPGRLGRLDHEYEDYEYERCGTCVVFMASEPLAGRRFTRVTERRTKIDWAHFLKHISEQYPHAENITLVMDNLDCHTPGALYRAFPPAHAKALRDRFEFVYTPKHGSWLNVAGDPNSTSWCARASTATSGKACRTCGCAASAARPGIAQHATPRGGGTRRWGGPDARLRDARDREPRARHDA